MCISIEKVLQRRGMSEDKILKETAKTVTKYHAAYTFMYIKYKYV